MMRVSNTLSQIVRKGEVLKEFILRKARDIRSDIVQYSSMLIAPVLALLYFIAYRQDCKLSCLIRFTLFSVYPIFVALFGRKGVFIQMIIYASVLQAFIPYNNFTEFFVVLISARMCKKLEIPAIALYILVANITLAVQGDSSVHISIHCFCCMFFYMIYFLIDRKIAGRHLVLTRNEKRILQALSDGSTQDCVDGYSKSTVARCLKKCRSKNNCKSTNELVEQFQEQS